MTNNQNEPEGAGEGIRSDLPEDRGTEVEAGTMDELSAEGGEEQQTEITLEEFNDLKARAAKADENWEKYVRLTADFDNYKKRAARERTEGMRYANESLIEKLLPVVDNFEAAIAATSAPEASMDSVRTGVNMIYTQLKSVLAENGAEEIDAIGQPFDPNLHEAVSQEATEEAPEGQVVKQLRKGYKLRDRLVRPAMVVVARKP